MLLPLALVSLPPVLEAYLRQAALACLLTTGLWVHEAAVMLLLSHAPTLSTSHSRYRRYHVFAFQHIRWHSCKISAHAPPLQSEVWKEVPGLTETIKRNDAGTFFVVIRNHLNMFTALSFNVGVSNTVSWATESLGVKIWLSITFMMFEWLVDLSGERRCLTGLIFV